MIALGTDIVLNKINPHHVGVVLVFKDTLVILSVTRAPNRGINTWFQLGCVFSHSLIQCSERPFREVKYLQAQHSLSFQRFVLQHGSW